MPPTCQVHRSRRKHRKDSESSPSGDQDSGTGQRKTIENEAEDCVVNRQPDPPVTSCSCGPEGCDLCLHRPTAHRTSVKRPLSSEAAPVHNASFDYTYIHKVQNFRLSPDSGRSVGTPAQKPSLVTLFINTVKNLWILSGSETSEDDPALPKCSVHDKQVEFVCLGCDELICQSCRSAEHVGHRTRSINLVTDEAQQRVFEAKDRIQHGLEKQLLKAWELNQQKRWESLAQLRHNAEGSIHQRHSQLIQIMGETFGEGDERYARVLRIIDEQRDLALRKLIAMANVTSRRFQTYDGYLNEELSTLSELLQRAEESITNIDPSQVLRVDKEIEAALSSVDITVRRFMAMPCYTKTVKHDFARADASNMFHASATTEEIEICVENFIGHPLTIATKVLNAFPGWQVSTDFRCCDEPETYVLSVCSYDEDKVAVSHTTSQDYSKGVVKLFNNDRHLIEPKRFGLGILVGQDTEMWQWYSYLYKKPLPFVDISVLGLTSKSQRSHKAVCLLYSIVTGWLLIPERQMITLMYLYLRAYGSLLHDILYEGVFEIQAVAPLLFDVSEDNSVLAIVDVKDQTCSPLENNLRILERVVYCIIFSPDKKTQRTAKYQPPTSDFIPSDVCIVSKGDNPTATLLVSDMGSSSIHVVVLNSQLRRRIDGSVDKQYRCELLYYLVADCPMMKQPTALNIDRKGRVWVACKGGQILRVEKGVACLSVVRKSKENQGQATPASTTN